MHALHHLRSFMTDVVYVSVGFGVLFRDYLRGQGGPERAGEPPVFPGGFPTTGPPAR